MRMPIYPSPAGTLRRLVPIALVLLSLACLLSLPFSARAEKMYVKPSAEVPIRSGQGTEYKILSVVPDGLQVEIIEQDEPWVKVRTEGGTEGWMLARYLDSTPPLSQVVASLKTRNSELEEANRRLRGELDELSLAHTSCSEELTACIIARDETLLRYETLREDTADVAAIKDQLAAARRETQEMRLKLETVQQANESLRRTIGLKWFLAGGGVLLVGWILGALFARGRSKKSSLY